MSAAAIEQLRVVPEVRQRTWASFATVLLDVVALELALLLGCAVRLLLHNVFPITLKAPQYQGLAVGVLSLPLLYWWVGLYNGYGMGAVERLRARVNSTVIVFAILLTWNYIFKAQQWSRGVMLITMGFALVVPPLIEAIFRKRLIDVGICGAPVLIMGAGRTGTLVAKQLKKESDLGFVPVAILDDDPRKWGIRIQGVPVVGPLSMASDFEGRAKCVLIAMPSLHRDKLSDLIQRLSFASVIVIPDLFGIQSLWITTRDIGGILGLEVRKNLLVPANRFLKRLLDYAIAAPLALVSIPVVAAAAAWIKIASPGSAFFKQEREGIRGKRITVYKLRTMYPDAERLLGKYLEENPDEKIMWMRFYKLRKDPRILPGIGWFLRRYSLDELPQVWNVLRGDMSLVGPRPFPYYHLDTFPKRFRSLRASVMPGLTGLWQVSQRSDGDVTVQQAEDTYYIRNWSPWLDVFILLRTLQCVLFARGAY